MQVNVSTRHGNLNEAARQKIIEKVERLGRLADRVNKIEVTVELEKPDQPTVDLYVGTELKKEFTAVYTSDNLMGCVDQVVDKVVNQMRKFKEKLTDHQ